MSNEAEVSISSTKNIVKNFNYDTYQLELIYRAKDGDFYHIKKMDELSALSAETKIAIEDLKHTIDIALPMTHGKY